MAKSYLQELKEKSENAIQARQKQVEDSKKSEWADDRFWKLSVDKTGNGEALIRFLPPKEGETKAFVEKYSHGFQGKTGRYYIEDCPTTIKENCPVCDQNKPIWAGVKSGIRSEAEARELTKETKRKHNFYANVLVIDDPVKPENNGKVFLFEYGVKIQEKIEEALKPLSARQKPIEPFDFFKGGNFLLIAKTVSRQRNYDSAKFEPQSVLSESDDELQRIIDATYSLEDIVATSKFKSYEVLSALLDKVNNSKTVTRETEEESETYPDEGDSSSKEFKLSSMDDMDELPF